MKSTSQLESAGTASEQGLKPASQPISGSFTPISFMLSLIKHRQLIWSLSKRQIESRYRGSIFGVIWTFFQPVFMLAVYTFVFSIVLQIRWGADTSHKGQFAVLIFSGLMIFNIVNACLTQSPTIMLCYPAYINKVVFPLEAIPVLVLIEAFFHGLMSFLVFFVVFPFVQGAVPWTVVYFPLLLIPLALVMMGIMWILASIGVFIRDLGQIMGVLATMLLFLSPIFYPLEMVPERFKFVLYLNPLTPWLEQIRGVLFWGQQPNFVIVATGFVAGWVISWIGFAWFMRVKKGFSDVV